MSDTALALPSRRGFLATLGVALVAAPAVVRAASIMPVRMPVVALRAPELLQVRALSGELATGDEVTFPGLRGNSLLTVQMITREAVRLFANSNKFIEHINSQYAEDFAFAKGDAANNFQWGSKLCIRLPRDYAVKRDG